MSLQYNFQYILLFMLLISIRVKAQDEQEVVQNKEVEMSQECQDKIWHNIVSYFQFAKAILNQNKEQFRKAYQENYTYDHGYIPECPISLYEHSKDTSHFEHLNCKDAAKKILEAYEEFKATNSFRRKAKLHEQAFGGMHGIYGKCFQEFFITSYDL